MKRLDESWQGWLKENITRGCKREELLGILLDNAFHIDDIARHMGDEFPADCERARRARGLGPARVDHAAIARARITRPDSGAERIPSDVLQIYHLPAFMSGAECDELVALIDRHLRKSTVTLAGTDDRYRTSRTADLAMFNYPAVARVDQRIAETLGIHPSHSEGIQAQRYDVGEEFKQHTDYFEPGTDEYREHASGTGNRTWTFMIYLNHVERGGGTRFYALGRDFMPVKGSAVIWNSLNADGTVNPHSLHAGLPVEAGHKIVITKWFRERGHGPLLFG